MSISGSAYLPVNSNWLQYIDSAETVFEDFKLESRQLLSLKADEACRLMENETYKQDLWMWDQDWSTKSLNLKKNIKKTKTVESNLKIESDDIENKILMDDKPLENNFEILNKEFVDSVDYVKNYIDNKKMKTLKKKFEYLYVLGKALPVKRPYLAGYPGWYRKLCTKPNNDPDWAPGANNITTSMQVCFSRNLCFLSIITPGLFWVRQSGWSTIICFTAIYQFLV